MLGSAHIHEEYMYPYICEIREVPYSVGLFHSGVISLKDDKESP